MPDHTAFTEEFADALLDPERQPNLFQGPAARVDAGLDVYRNNVMYSLMTALADIFPVVQALVGKEFFAGLARTYVRSEPPVSPVLADYGRTFADFLNEFEPARQAPYLSDVARLERAWLDAYHAPDAKPLDAKNLTAVPLENYAVAAFTCQPSLSCVASPYPVCTIWEAHQRESEIPEINFRQGGEETLVVRPLLDVKVHRVPPGTADFIRVLRHGHTLAEAVEILSAADGEFDLGTAMSLLIDFGAFTSFCIRTNKG